MHNRKKFEQFISKHFAGLSAYTLTQLIQSYTGHPQSVNEAIFKKATRPDVKELWVEDHSDSDNMVYNMMYKYFTGIRTDAVVEVYIKLQKMLYETGFITIEEYESKCGF